MSFKDKYKVNDAGCWIWKAGKDKDGYGLVKYQRKTYRAHRLSYQMHTGVDPEKMQVLHKCDTPSCVNPSCLFLGTNKDNMADRNKKGRQAKQKGVLHGSCALTEKEVKLIRAFAKRHPPSLSSREMGFGVLRFLSRWFGLKYQSIHDITSGRNWSHL